MEQKSTLYNVRIKGFLLSSFIFNLDSPCLFFCDKMPICNFNVFICFHYWSQYKIQHLRCHVTSRAWVKNPIGRLRNISKISSRNLCIGFHSFHRCLYFLWPGLFCTIVRFIIYIFWFERTICHIFFVLVNSLSWLFQVQKICNLVIIRPTSEAHIWISIFMFIIFMLGWGELKYELDFLFSFLFFFKHFSVFCDSPQRLHLDWESFATSLPLIELFKFK